MTIHDDAMVEAIAREKAREIDNAVAPPEQLEHVVEDDVDLEEPDYSGGH